jgi:hypothetical protein
MAMFPRGYLPDGFFPTGYWPPYVSTLALSPTSMPVNSTGAIGLTGGSTAWSPGTPGSPLFTVSSGTKNSQSVATFATASLNYTAPAGAGTVTVGDPSTGQAASLTITAVAALAISPTTVVQGSTGTIALIGTLTAWGVGTPGTPTFTVSSGTKNSQIVTSTTAGSLNFTAPGSPGSVTITDPSTTKTATLIVVASSPGKTSIRLFGSSTLGM